MNAARTPTIVALGLIAALAPLAGCSLLLDANEHIGGDAMDAGQRSDAGRDDGGDAGPRDGGQVDGGGEVDDGGLDAGQDGGPPPVPECTVSTDCGADTLVQCVASRCVFCAAATEAPYMVRRGAGLRPLMALDIRRRPAGPPLVLLATIGEDTSTPTLVHRFEIESPSAATDHGVDSAVAGGCFDETDLVVEGLAFDGRGDDDGTSTGMGVVARGSSGQGLVTQLAWYDTSGTIESAGYTCRSRTAPADVLATTTILETGSDTLQVTRERRGDGSMGLATWAFPYAAGTEPRAATNAPTGAFEPMTRAGRFAVMPASTASDALFWDPRVTVASPSRVPTPGRTGPPDALAISDGSPGDYLLAFPVGDRVRFVTARCDTSCSAVGESADLRTDAVAVERVRLGMAIDTPVILTSERLADGRTQVVLRVLRATRAPYDAPGGGRALVLDTVPADETVVDIRLDVLDGTTARYAAAWMRDDGAESSAHVQTFIGTCAP